MSITLGDLAEYVSGTLYGDVSVSVTGVAGIDEASKGDLTFLNNDRYRNRLATCQATVVIVPNGMKVEGTLASIEVENPSLAFTRAIELFQQQLPSPAVGIHERACVATTAVLGEGVTVSAFAVIEEHAAVGDRTLIYPGVYVGHEAKIGEDCTLFPGSFVGARVVLGNRVILQPGAVVGSDGFGYLELDGLPVKVPQTGIVELADDVEIGAGTTIDRARFDATRLARGVKLDNLVQIAHNVKIGEGTCIAAQSGVAGSTQIGQGVLLGGQVGIVGHLTIGDGVRLAAKAGVSRNVPDGTMVAGTPAMPARQYWKIVAMTRKLPSILAELSELREKVLRLEGKSTDDSEAD